MSEVDIHALRTNGIGCCITLENKAYMGPGMGVTTASTPLKITRANDFIHRCVRELAKLVCEKDSHFRVETAKLGIEDPSFMLVVTPRGLTVYENVSACAFLLTKPVQADESTFLDELCNLVAPNWAIKFLLSSTEN